MKELTLQQIRNVELDLLNVFDKYCKENDIKYFLSNGTLLGAVKYKGFIPWDDDIDVFVPREDYDRLIATFKDSEKYRLFAFERERAYKFPFAKLCDLTTVKEEGNINNGVSLGIDMDIFPLDAWNDDFDKACKEVKNINRNMFLLGLSKSKSPSSRTLLKRIVKSFLMIACKACGSKVFIQNIIKKSKLYNLQGSVYCGCKSWCIYNEREIIPSETFADVVQVEFEGNKYPAPVGYDTYLRSLYGDYRQDPPLEKQKTHHSFKAYIR